MPRIFNACQYRLASVVAPGVPRHVTQRGNRPQRRFFSDDDDKAYIGLMAEWCCRCGVAIWAYCLMRNARHRHTFGKPQLHHEAGFGGHIHAPPKTRIERLDARCSKFSMVSPELTELTDEPVR